MTAEPHGVPAIGTMRFELAPVPGGCILVFTDVVAFDATRSRSDSINSGPCDRHSHRDVLEQALQGGQGDPREFDEFDDSSIEIGGRE